MSFVPAPPSRNENPGRQIGGHLEGKQTMRELPEFIEPLPTGLKARMEQSSHAPAVTDETEATLGSRTGLPVS